MFRNFKKGRKKVIEHFTVEFGENGTCVVSYTTINGVGLWDIVGITNANISLVELNNDMIDELNEMYRHNLRDNKLSRILK